MCLKLMNCNGLLGKTLSSAGFGREKFIMWCSWPEVGVGEHWNVSYTELIGMLCHVTWEPCLMGIKIIFTQKIIRSGS
jgi:hypothetical protein